MMCVFLEFILQEQRSREAVQCFFVLWLLLHVVDSIAVLVMFQKIRNIYIFII